MLVRKMIFDHQGNDYCSVTVRLYRYGQMVVTKYVYVGPATAPEVFTLWEGETYASKAEIEIFNFHRPHRVIFEGLPRDVSLQLGPHVVSQAEADSGQKTTQITTQDLPPAGIKEHAGTIVIIGILVAVLSIGILKRG